MAVSVFDQGFGWRLASALAFAAFVTLPDQLAAQDFDETAHLGTLMKYLNRGAEGEDFHTGFDRLARCGYELRFGQSLGGAASRHSVTQLDFADITTEAYHQTYYDIGIGEVTLSLREEADDVFTALTLTDPEGTQRQEYLDVYGGDCDGDICTMTVPGRDVSFVVLGPGAQDGKDFVLLALEALVNACAPGG